MSTDTNDTDNTNGSDSTTLGAIRGALERIPNDDGVDQAAALVQRLRIARKFDAVKKREEVPEPLIGSPTAGGQRYRVEAQASSEWLEATYVEEVQR